MCIRDSLWIDVSESVSLSKAKKIWLEKTNKGTEKVCYDNIDYYYIFPANTKMMFN